MRRSRIEEREKSSTAPQKKNQPSLFEKQKSQKICHFASFVQNSNFFFSVGSNCFCSNFHKTGKSEIKNFFVDSSQLISTETRFRWKSYFACGAGSGSDFFGFSTGFGFGSGFGSSSPSSVGIK